MRKINYILIVLIYFLSFLTIIGEFDKGIVIVLKDASIVLTLTIPYIINKLFKVNISDIYIIFWIIFIFFAHYLGVTLELYNSIPFFDKVVHTLSGVVSACVASIILLKCNINKGLFNILFIISFSLMCAGFWEMFEFTCDNLFGYDAQLVSKTGVSDTMGDIIVAFLGSILYSIFYKARV